jgi:serine/threonine-protein kinase
MGTPLYMSPEQVEGKPLDCRTDIYSFGVTCYHMLAGHPPYEGQNAFEVALQHVRGSPKPLAEIRPDLPPLLCAIVHKMMARDPAERYQTGRELLRELVRLREGLNSSALSAVTPRDLSVEMLPAATTPPSSPTMPAVAVAPPTSMMPAPPRRGWAFALFVLTVLLALAAGVAVGWLRRQGMAAPPPPLSATAEQEKALRSLLESYLKPDKDGRYGDATLGLRLCQELAVLCLSQDRLDDADELFRRLKEHEFRRYKFLGGLGSAVVLGLRNDPARAHESNEQFKALQQQLESKRPRDPELVKLFQNPAFKEYLGRAVRNNVHNGVPEEEVPGPLREYLRDKDRGAAGK